MKNAQVDIRLSGPVILDPYATLDGTLAWCAVQEAKANGGLTSFKECEENLPLKKEQLNGLWFYRASSWFVSPGTVCRQTEIHLHRRFPEGLARRIINDPNMKLKLDAGIDKNYRIPFYPYELDMVSFLFTGDAGKVEYLLKKWLFAIGKKASAGFGAVRDIKVIAADEDPIVTTSGFARRPIPETAAERVGVRKGLERKALHTYHPPYALYYTEDQSVCIMPEGPELRGVPLISTFRQGLGRLVRGTTTTKGRTPVDQAESSKRKGGNDIDE